MCRVKCKTWEINLRFFLNAEFGKKNYRTKTSPKDYNFSQNHSLSLWQNLLTSDWTDKIQSNITKYYCKFVRTAKSSSILIQLLFLTKSIYFWFRLHVSTNIISHNYFFKNFLSQQLQLIAKLTPPSRDAISQESQTATIFHFSSTKNSYQCLN